MGRAGQEAAVHGQRVRPWREWNHDAELDWGILRFPTHAGLRTWVRDLNRFYRATPALHATDFHRDGFAWVDCSDNEQSVVAFLRRTRDRSEQVLVVANLTPVPRERYRLGVPRGGRWEERLNSDAEVYGGSGMGNQGGVDATPMRSHGHEHSLLLTLPPLSTLFFAAPAPDGGARSTDADGAR